METVDTASLADATIEAIHTFVCEPVHPAWVNELTLPVATAWAVLQLADGRLLSIAPCEIVLTPGGYPSLGLEVAECDGAAMCFQTPDGKTYNMKPHPGVTIVLPFEVQSVTRSDPLGEGGVSELVFGSGTGSRLVFRHIMPPMTLGIDWALGS